MTATFHPIATRTHRTHRTHRIDPAVPHYGARRIAAVAVLATVVLLLALAASALVDAAIGVGGRPAAASDAAPTTVVRVHVAQPGDTLWSIAERYRGEVGQGRFVDALVDLNGGTSIQVGQAVHLP